MNYVLVKNSYVVSVIDAIYIIVFTHILMVQNMYTHLFKGKTFIEMC